MANRLVNETSPYLLQHSHNPVDWHPWGDEALARARGEDRPILLSIGYSACHWCHVMAHESFEDPRIAAFMNENFINIKVDREERPDLDAVYMEAVQAMTGGGGWPLTVFLTSEGRPFYGGTYFPPQDRGSTPGFLRVLETVAGAYQDRRRDVEDMAGHVMAALSSMPLPARSAEPPTADLLHRAYHTVRNSFDRQDGGFGPEPKFPQPMTLEFLMQYYATAAEPRARDTVEFTLRKMARGGIYDQLGGGFHRYSVDRQWLVPHFEKMLYDNAQLSRVYLHAHIISGDRLFLDTAEGTLDYVLREMTGQHHGFYSSQDADSEGVEGKYYLWTPAEVIEAAGEERGRLLNEHFDVTEQGNFEGRNVLHVAADVPPGAREMIDEGKVALLRRRERRVRPARDEKAVAAWNGLMLASLSEAACALERPDYLEAARANGAFLLREMVREGRLRHSCKDGPGKAPGFLQDYAAVVDGLLALHQATFEGRWLNAAIELGSVMADLFWDGAAGSFYDTSAEHESLFIRPQSITDNPLPSGPSAATMAALKLARLTDDRRLEDIAVRSLGTVQQHMVRQPLGLSHWLSALDFYLSEPLDIALVGPAGDPASAALLRRLWSKWLPHKVVAARDPGDDASPDLPILRERDMVDGRPAAFVCRRHVCQEPVTDPEELARTLG